MSLAKEWLSMAEESIKAATTLAGEGHSRSSASRAYYGAFQAATALLHHLELKPPIVSGQRREAWAHAVTPDLIRDNLSKIIKNRKFKNELAAKIGSLYKLRCDADYNSTSSLSKNSLDSAMSDAGIMLKVAIEGVKP